MSDQQASRRRYEILGTLGRGGFGTVYLARLLGEEGFSKAVALKMLHANLLDRPELVGRFRDEARILGLIRHRAVVQVDDLVRLDGSWTIVMEYVDGVDLHQMLRSGPIPPRAALEIVQEVASALDVALHTTGPDRRPLKLLHRDIKPGNLLLSSAGEVKVLDFGIAKADFEEREGVTKSMGFGSPEYMSPERLEWENGPAADVYALGCVLFELLTAKRVGISTGHPDRHQARIDEVAAQIRTQLGEGAAGIAELVHQMLAYEVDHRPTAREVEARCEALIGATGGVRLRAWAGTAVPEARALLSAPLAAEAPGRVVVESALPTTPAGLPTTKPGSALRWVAIGAAASVLLVGTGGGLALLALSRGTGPAPQEQPTQAAAPPTPPAQPPTAPEPAPDPTPAPAQDVTPNPNPAPTVKPTQHTSQGQRREPEGVEAPVKAHVSLGGDAARVRLIGAADSYALPGDVPAGDYKVEVSAEGRETQIMGAISLVAGQRSELTCNLKLRLCKAL